MINTFDKETQDRILAAWGRANQEIFKNASGKKELFKGSSTWEAFKAYQVEDFLPAFSNTWIEKVFIGLLELGFKWKDDCNIKKIRDRGPVPFNIRTKAFEFALSRFPIDIISPTWVWSGDFGDNYISFDFDQVQAGVDFSLSFELSPSGERGGDFVHTSLFKKDSETQRYIRTAGNGGFGVEHYAEEVEASWALLKKKHSLPEDHVSYFIKISHFAQERRNAAGENWDDPYTELGTN